MNTINTNTAFSATYAARSYTSSLPDVRQSARAAELDSYQRSDGSVATRLDKVVDDPQKSESVLEDTVSSGTTEDPRFRELLHQFVGQTLFGQMLKSMRATQEKNPYFHGGRAEEIFQSQLDMQLTDEMTKASSKTLSDPMYKLMTAKKTAV
ncbi:MAG: rod-binding protein [Planctomycetaceae bacterium]|jgi:hypothetical protein|nr:rod-binding protein [Planctomycetaceae bacterium]